MLIIRPTIDLPGGLNDVRRWKSAEGGATPLLSTVTVLPYLRSVQASYRRIAVLRRTQLRRTPPSRLLSEQRIPFDPCTGLVAMNPSSWREYRKWRNVSLFALVGFVPFVFSAGVLSMRLFDTFTPAFVLSFACLAFAVIVGNICLRFPCPRCRKAFFAKWWYYNGFAQRCVHCGLPKYAAH